MTADDRFPPTDTDRMDELRLHSMAFSSIDDLLMVIDRDLRVVTSNWKTLYGIDLQTPRHHSHCYEILMGRDTPCPACRVGEVFQTARPKTVEQIDPASGRMRQIRLIPVLGAENRVEWVVEHIRDVEEQRQREAEFLRMAETMGDGLAALDANRCITYPNDRLCRLLGYDRREVAGRCFTDFFPQSLRLMRNDPPPEDAADQGPPRETIFVCKDGRTGYALVQPRWLADADGRCKGALITVTDITERKLAEIALQETEAFTSGLLHHSPNPILVLNPDMTIRYVNPAFETITGFSSADLLGTAPPFPWWTRENLSKIHRDFAAAMQTGIDRVEETFQTKEARPIWVEVTAQAVRRDGAVDYFLSTWTDITQRKSAEEKLRQSEERYRSLVDNIAIGVALISADMEILTLNRQMKEWFPQVISARRPLCYRSFNDPPRDGICSYCPTHLTLADGRVHEATTQTPTGDSVRNYRILASPIKDNAGNVVSAIEMVEDVTDRIRYEEQIHTLTHELMRAQENERRMISRELHDRVAQDLSSLKILCETLFDRQSDISPNLNRKVSDMAQRLRHSILAVRDLSYDLRPPGLEEMGLVECLCQYCDDFSESAGIRVDFHAAGIDPLALDSDAMISLYRLVQEALNNIRKHADARRVSVRLVAAHPQIILRIYDDGKGFDVEKRLAESNDEKRMGLRSMEERVRLLQGRMKLRSIPGQGTKITIKIPHRASTDES
jgi:PAS domain S-box-containing protein